MSSRAAIGFNAALLAELVGPHGHVVTIEYDQDLTDSARDAISRTGYADRIEVRDGDGAGSGTVRVLRGRAEWRGAPPSHS